MDDETIFRTIRERLFTAVIGDVMDAAGLARQFLPPGIRSLNPDHVLVGRALTVQEADCTGDVLAAEGRPDPFGLMFRALDSLRPGEVYITTGASPTYALWGGLMSTRAKALGAAGAVLDGFHRDTREIMALGLPVFSMGAYAQDQRLRGRVIDFGGAITFGNGVRVERGDIVVGDIDGVLVIPRAQEGDILAAALEKAAAEDKVRDMIGAGRSTQAIFDEMGVM